MKQSILPLWRRGLLRFARNDDAAILRDARQHAPQDEVSVRGNIVIPGLQSAGKSRLSRASLSRSIARSSCPRSSAAEAQAKMR